MQRFTILFLLLFACFNFLKAQTADVFSAELKENIKHRVEDHTNMGIVIALIDGEEVNYYSYGYKKSGSEERVDENSVFEIGSISKTFTGILLANAVVKGKMNLEDPIDQYFPEGTKAPSSEDRKIKLYELSNHTSALPRMPTNFTPADISNPYADYTEEQLFDFLASVELTREIGSEFEYSNLAVGLLGQLISKHHKSSYEALMSKVITKPLGMKNTAITLSADMKNNLAYGHVGETVVSNWDIPTLAGAGAIRSTAVDMVKYVQANMGIKKSKLSKAMDLSHKNSRAADASPKIGLGWLTTQPGEKEIVWHNGGTGGYRSYAGFLKDKSKGVVVLSNSSVGIDDIGIHLLDPSSPLKAIEKTISVSEATLDKYLGTYELAPGFSIVITRDGKQLKGQATGQPIIDLFPKSETEFVIKVVEASIQFNLDDEGEVEGLTLFQGGQELPGKKIK